MEILRTPDERFKNPPDFNFAPHYVEIAGLRIHYVIAGAGHFLQEDKGAELAQIIADFISRTEQ